MAKMTEGRQSLQEYQAAKRSELDRRGGPKKREFRPVPHYSKLGDFLWLYLSDELSYSERVDSVLTVYRSKRTREIIGCKIKGVSLLAKNVVNFFDIHDGAIQLRLLLLSANGPKEPREHYYDLVKRLKEMSVPTNVIFGDAA